MSRTTGRDTGSLVEKLARAFQDTRALGIGAPMRAGYEMSKKFGGHNVVFGHFVPTSSEIRSAKSPFAVRDVPTTVRDRTIAAANRILDGTIELFGRSLTLGDTPDWHSAIHTDGSWPVIDWWKIDIRSSSRLGDIKWAWELGRHRHLVIVARAAYLAPDDDRYGGLLNSQIQSWLQANPPEVGVHWYSNLEIALRALAWLQVLALAGDQIEREVQAGMWQHLRHSGRHLVADLPYTVSTMRNNHLLGDALGLIALGTALPGRAGDRWRHVGSRIFDWQLVRHMRSDGSMIEDSVSYHRFVLEMLSMRVLLGSGSDAASAAMQDAAQFFARLGVLEGSVPQYGDWDEGRVFATAEDPVGLAGSVYLALALAGNGAPSRWRDEHDEVAWFVDDGVPVAPDAAEQTGHTIGASIGRANVGPFAVWLKGGYGPSHGHADLTSVSIAYEGKWLIADPGTGTYNGRLEERSYFRGSSSHNVLRPGGEDQLIPYRAFRWVHEATGVLGDPVIFDDTIIMWAVHDAYMRLSPPRRVVRMVAVTPDRVEVYDHVEGPPAMASLALPLHSQAVWNPATSLFSVCGNAFSLELPAGHSSVVRGTEEPYAGWWSDTYGHAEPATAVQLRWNSVDSIRWAVAKVDAQETHAYASGSNAFRWSVHFDESRVRLRIKAANRVFLRSV